MIHIVPTVPPEANGLADYCYQLWNHWPQPRPEWKCLVGHLPPQARELWPQGNVSAFELSHRGLVDALKKAELHTVVLHYVGYAYHPKGVPTWLPAALREWKQSHQSNRLVVMYHELYADQTTWKQSSFWLRPFAKGIMISLAQLCDRWVTSCPDYARKIQTEARTSPDKGAVIPIGTPFIAPSGTTIKPWPLFHGSQLKIVLFGLPNTRLWALQAHENMLRDLCNAGLVERITILGKPPADDQNQVAMAEICQRIGSKQLWQEKFNPSVEEISRVVSEHDLGLLANHTGVLSKSSVYPLLCEHRVASVVSAHEAHNDSSEYPCFINNDTQSRQCVRNLQNPEVVTATQQAIEYAAQHVLNWSSITDRWREIVVQVEHTPA